MPDKINRIEQLHKNLYGAYYDPAGCLLVPIEMKTPRSIIRHKIFEKMLRMDKNANRYLQRYLEKRKQMFIDVENIEKDYDEKGNRIQSQQLNTKT